MGTLLEHAGRRLARYLARPDPRYTPLATSSAESLVAALQPCDVLLEADVVDGIRLVPLTEYAGMHTRICRPVGLVPEDRDRIVELALSRLGNRYDLRNLVDLARYLLPQPPVPARWRRRMLALGSGEPTRAICSTSIARLFQRVRYPILPRLERRPSADDDCNTCHDEILHIRHHSLFAPRDFDISPYFRIVKPTIEQGFDYHDLAWSEAMEEAQ